MKLLTHNILKSNVKGVKVGYPLALKATQIQTLNVPFNPEFVKNMLSRIEYPVLQAAAAAVRTLLNSSQSSSPLADPDPTPPSRFSLFIAHNIGVNVKLFVVTFGEAGFPFTAL